VLCVVVCIGSRRQRQDEIHDRQRGAASTSAAIRAALALTPTFCDKPPSISHMQGVFRCRPNDKNHRDLDIEIEYRFAGRHSELESVQPYRLR
jgi:hypothetical protein